MGGRVDSLLKRAAPVAAAAAVLALAAAPAPGHAGLIGGSADAAYGRSTSATGGGATLDQNYMLRFQQQAFDWVGYRLSLGFTDNLAMPDRLPSTRLQRLLPIASVDLRRGIASGQLQYDGIYESASQLSSGIDARQERALAQAALRPSGAVSLLLEATHAVRSNDPRTYDNTEDVATATVTYKPGALRLDQSVTYRGEREAVLQFSRRQLGTMSRIGYERELVPGYHVGGRYTLQYDSTSEDTTSGFGILAPRRLIPAGGLYGYDDLPLQGALGGAPALVDGNTSTSSGIAVGPPPDGTSFQNVGVDMGQVLEVDQLIVYVRDATGRPVVSGGAISWTAYASVDGVVWQALSTAADFTGSTYSITFPAAQAQFFKVVNVGTNTLPTYVTELEVFVHEPLTASSQRARSFLNQSGQLTASASPVRWLTFTTALRATGVVVRDDLAPTARSTTSGQTYTAQAGPWRDASLILTHSRLGSTTDVSSRDQTYSEAKITFVPIREISTQLFGAYGTEDAGRFWTRTTTVQASGLVTPIPSTRLSASAGYITQERAEQAGAGEYATGAFRADVRITSRLDATAFSTGQWVLSQPGAASATSPLATLLIYHRHYLEGRYAPGPQLLLQARIGYAAALSSGWTQNYRVAWLPFTGGDLTLSTGFDDDIDFVADQRATRIYAGAGWRINRMSSMDATYARQTLRVTRSTGTVSNTQDVVLVSLRIAF